MKKMITLRRLCMRMLPLAGALFMLGVSARAQEREISGSVTDEGGNPVIGAVVAVTGTSTGTSSGANGTFRLKIPADAKTLTIKFIGMVDREIPIENNKKIYNIVMADQSTDIEDVVVIGYGVVAKRDLTGAVSSVTGKTLASIPMANTASALTGRMAGVQITTTDGSPDADVKIRVRGGGSITQDNSPLYIVDGFPVERISDISLNDIQNIDVLKDASSSAIYGARGANGVVIITTKSATAGRTVVSYNGYAQMRFVPDKIDVLNPYEFTLLQYELNNILGNTQKESFRNIFGTPDDFDIYKTMPGHDYQEEMYGRTAWGQSHNLSLGGGTDKTKFNLSATHVDEDGVLITSGFERTNLNFKLNHQLYRTVKLDLSTYYTRTTIYGAGTTANTSSEIRNTVSYRPIVGKGSWTNSDFDVDPEDFSEMEVNSQLYNPIEVIRNDYKRVLRSDLNVNGAVSWNISKKLTWRSSFGLLSRNTETRRYYGPPTSKSRAAGSLGVAQLIKKENPRWTTTHTLTYNLKNFKKHHNLTLMGGFEALSETSYEVELNSQGLPISLSPDEIFANLALGSRETPLTFDGIPVSLTSFFGRANYDYKRKILISATFRADGSSKFAPGRQWGYFPSGAVAWRISDEPFLKPVNWIHDLKLRASFGMAGNNRIDSGMWNRSFKTTFNALGIAGFGGAPNVYYTNYSKTLIHQDLKWETTITRNIGVDFSLFKGRLSGTLETYLNSTRDLLLKHIIPAHKGYPDQQVNKGATSSRGLELTLNGVIVEKKDFSLTANFNIGFNRTRVEDIGGGNRLFYPSGWSGEVRETEDYLLQLGQPVGLIYGYVTDGFYTLDEVTYGLNPASGKTEWYTNEGVADSRAVTGGRVLPGSLKLKKISDDGDPDISKNDRTVIGNANPLHSGGFNLAAVYKGFDLSAFFTWSYGNDIYNAQKITNSTTWKYQWQNLRNEFNSTKRFRYFDEAGNDLRYNPDALRELNRDASIWSPIQSYPVLHSWAVEDGSFLRLSNLTLGYTIPQKITKKLYISRLRVYVTGSNLFCWTKYTGFDPEVDTRRSTPLSPGVDYSAYPKTTGYAFGVNLTF